MATATQTAPDLRTICQELRLEIIEMIHRAESGHPGGSLSAVEILVALFWGPLRHDPKNPAWPERDRLILSKGHGCPALYSVLARRGYFPREELSKLRQLGAMLQGHPVRSMTPGIEANTGALGQGMAIAQGMALASRLGGSEFHVWCITGDGELNEGTIWETAMSAGKFKVDDLTVIIDYNKGQIDGHTDEVMPLEPLAGKWKAFNWHVIELKDGHDLAALARAYDEALNTKGKPTVIIANTVKGKGVSFMENQIKWHGSAPNKEETEKALAEIRAMPV
jgi:transketolase